MTHPTERKVSGDVRAGKTIYLRDLDFAATTQAAYYNEADCTGIVRAYVEKSRLDAAEKELTELRALLKECETTIRDAYKLAGDTCAIFANKAFEHQDCEKELVFDEMGDGTMASYIGQFTKLLSKLKGRV